MSLSDLLQQWQNDADTNPNIAAWKKIPARAALWQNLPADLNPMLAQMLASRGIDRLYQHQALTWNTVKEGRNVVLCTGTASGKSLAYNLPVLNQIMEDDTSKALYIFPTKALTQDQFTSLVDISGSAKNDPIRPAIYDGDTRQADRPAIRKTANILLTNPEMLHTGILPHHTNWSVFFSGLRFIVIDEVHTYRGVFGSNFANVLRRLLRIAHFYGAFPQVIMTSATIANPTELATKLCGMEVTLVDEDGSARGEKNFLIYNPPVVNQSLGLRKSSVSECVRLAQDLLKHDLQSIVFARTRRTVEIVLKYLRDTMGKENRRRFFKPDDLDSLYDLEQVQGYRSGYLPAERRKIEKGLRDGEVKVVVATSALELGIDIGDLKVALMLGYPGSIASLLQQSGRAGRGIDPSIAILITTAQPLDQYLAHHSDYIFSKSPEHALLDPNHIVILLNHLRCALFELPFKAGDKFGDVDVDEFLTFLEENKEAYSRAGKTFWMADAYPSANISLRTASPNSIVLQSEEGGVPRVIGQVDLESAYWMVHPRAVYLHAGQQYFVQSLDLEAAKATLVPVALEYFTEPTKEDDIEKVSLSETMLVPGGDKSKGEIIVHSKVTGFKKKQWGTSEILDMELLDLPETELNTTGYWFQISEPSQERIAKAGLWTNSPNDYGSKWPAVREEIRRRDEYKCQACGNIERGKQHDVHHKSPFREIVRRALGELSNDQQLGNIEIPQEILDRANRADNLITLCHECHKKVEQNVRMRSGLAGLAYVFQQLAPLFLMCDAEDIGVYFHPEAEFCDKQPAVALYDMVPAGIGFSEKLYELHGQLVDESYLLVNECPCDDGCPACVGPAGENGTGGKKETLAILKEMRMASV